MTVRWYRAALVLVAAALVAVTGSNVAVACDPDTTCPAPAKVEQAR